MFRDISKLSMVLITASGLFGQAPPPPPPGPPPYFMTMKGLPLGCFDKPFFEEETVDLYVCNGGGGLAGFRRKGDVTGSIFVRDYDLAQNLNMKNAKRACGGGKFGVRQDPSGVVSFECRGEQVRIVGRFKVGSKADFTKYGQYLEKY
jgi:hypothetical protein